VITLHLGETNNRIGLFVIVDDGVVVGAKEDQVVIAVTVLRRLLGVIARTVALSGFARDRCLDAYA
jgi:hypothetical protein